MEVHFYIKYNTNYGENLVLQSADNKKDAGFRVGMKYLSDEWWTVSVDSDVFDEDEIRYSYCVNYLGTDIRKLNAELFLNYTNIKGETLHVVDEWRDGSVYNDIFNTRPFNNVLNKDTVKTKKTAVRNATHYFNVRSGRLPGKLVICITGSTKNLGDWESAKPLLLNYDDGMWTGKANLSAECFPLQYKVGVYDTDKKEIVLYEQGNNRVVYEKLKKNEAAVFNILAEFPELLWRGTGLNVPVSALKTKKSWGVGDFTDLIPTVDLCKKTGVNLVQLLPVNDTTATFKNKDSYPYSAITAFALHPIYLNVEQVAKKYSFRIPKQLATSAGEMNLMETLSYENVLQLKWEVINGAFEKGTQKFLKDKEWLAFFETNKHWLAPYAAFCYLRDEYKTADFSKWGVWKNYNADRIEELSREGNKAYKQILKQYFVQYQLHLQLKEATEYAHKNGIIMKADLPIGVGRLSVETWMYPNLFHMDMQAGAPPDNFAVMGQNWSFPTYNWEVMARDNYRWWRERMGQLSNYFDAVRIDHVLGFFRIWSIPAEFVQGIMGRFVPAIPVSRQEFENYGLWIDEDRLCKPFVNEEILWQTFGHRLEFVLNTFFDGNSFKDEFNTQRKISTWLDVNPGNEDLKPGLFGLLTNVVLLKDVEHDKYHFRISPFNISSWQYLNDHEKHVLNVFYDDYFFKRQNNLWEQEGFKKLEALKKAANNMLLCAEDLGMVPEMVPGILKNMQIVSLQVERMPKISGQEFSGPATAGYDTIVTPSTHDMSTLREWWEEDRNQTQNYFNQLLGNYGDAPYYCEPWVAAQIIHKHLQSRAILSVFLLQDLLAMNSELRRVFPNEERINIPADPDHFWNYRMHIDLEKIIDHPTFSQQVKELISNSGR